MNNLAGIFQIDFEDSALVCFNKICFLLKRTYFRILNNFRDEKCSNFQQSNKNKDT